MISGHAEWGIVLARPRSGNDKSSRNRRRCSQKIGSMLDVDEIRSAAAPVAEEVRNVATQFALVANRRRDRLRDNPSCRVTLESGSIAARLTRARFS